MRSLKQTLIFSLLLLTSISSASTDAETKALQAFPEARVGMQRFVIYLDEKNREQEQNFMVQLQAGKELLTDGVNRVRLGSAIKPQTLQGWGYTYYEVDNEKATLSTMMAAPEGAEKVSEFVTTAPLNIRYNSRLPIVIYAPDDYQIKYRIWEAPAAYQNADKK